ncbi:hypothetical protein AB0H73_06390 [Streptomyces olivoreticuli]
MEYTCTTIKSDGETDAASTKYAEKVVTNTLRAALAQGYNLAANASSGELTLTCNGQTTIIVTPAEPLPKPTRPQWREVLALASSPGPVVWAYGTRNVIQMRDGERLLVHSTTMSLINGGYLGPLTGEGNPADLSLLAYLVLGAGQKDVHADQWLAQALTRAYRAPSSAV